MELINWSSVPSAGISRTRAQLSVGQEVYFASWEMGQLTPITHSWTELEHRFEELGFFNWPT